MAWRRILGTAVALDSLATAIVGYLVAFHGKHWDVRTPAWLGRFVPWDMLFGSWRNPREFRGECGFASPADRRFGATLGFADVNAAAYGVRSRGAMPPAMTRAHAGRSHSSSTR